MRHFIQLAYLLYLLIYGARRYHLFIVKYKETKAGVTTLLSGEK